MKAQLSILLIKGKFSIRVFAVALEAHGKVTVAALGAEKEQENKAKRQT